MARFYEHEATLAGDRLVNSGDSLPVAAEGVAQFATDYAAAVGEVRVTIRLHYAPATEPYFFKNLKK